MFKKVSNAPISLEELKELSDYEPYLKDYIQNDSQMKIFAAECASLEDQTRTMAIENTKFFEQMSMAMERHNQIVELYNSKRDALKEAL